MPVVCGCDPDRTLEHVYLGPGEGLEHQTAVLLAKESFLRERRPDFQIRCKHDPGYHTSVRKSDVVRESLVLRQAISRQGRKKMNNITVDEPVLPVHLTYLNQFLYTGEYAVEAMDVEDFPIDKKKYPNGCWSCMNHLRLLSLHLSIFHAARYLGMEMLQLLALQKFGAAASHATSTVLRYILQNVYTIEPQTPMHLHMGMYSLVGWIDYRPMIILPVIMEYIRKHKPAIQSHYDSVMGDWNTGFWTERVRATWPEADEFAAMRSRIPEFDLHMEWAEVVLALEDYFPRPWMPKTEATGDLLDNLEQFVSQNWLIPTAMPV